MTTEIILEMKKLTKYYGKNLAVDEINLQIPRGMCFGLLGPNGAGKSTTIEMLEGIIPATKGEILYKNSPRNMASYKQEIGIQFQSTALIDHMLVKEALSTFKAFYQKTWPIDDLIEVCNLKNQLNQKHNQLSGGQRQRLLLALALINDPTLVFLDEPTTGLDPQARQNFWKLVQKIKGRGKTIILTTHYMEEAEILCDQLAIINRGKILDKDSPSVLLEKYLEGPFLKAPIQEKALIEKVYENIEIKGDWIQIRSNKRSLNQLIQLAIDNNLDLQKCSIHRPNLEDLFLHLTGGSLTAEESDK